MKKSLLLTLALFAGSSAAIYAQTNIMKQDFSAEQTASPTDVGWYEFINSQEGDTRVIQDGALHFYNSQTVEGSSWQRAVKFRNLPLKENTSYRVTVHFCGDNTYNLDGKTDVKSKAHFALMQGQENGDVALLAPDSTQQGADISYFQSKDKGYAKYTQMFFFASKALQEEYYSHHKGTEDQLAEKFFLTFNAYNPGDYYLDDISVDEAAIDGVYFNYEVVRVNFGYATNAKALLTAAGVKKLVYPEGTATVSVNGKTATIMTTELREDGYLYIFLDPDVAGNYPESADAKVLVSFKNPTDTKYQLLYTGKAYPGCMEGKNAVADFTDQTGSMDEGITDAISSIYDTPTLVTADPEDGSFNLVGTQRDVKLTFNKEVDCAKVTATMDGAAMTVTPADGYSKVITVSAAADIANGEHSVAVTHIYPQRSYTADDFTKVNLTLNYGKVSTDPTDTTRIVMKDSIQEIIKAKGEGTVPYGWEITNAAKVVAQGTNPGSGPRTFKFADGGDMVNTFYFRTSAANDGGHVTYGKTAGYLLTLEAGKKYRISYNLAAWKGTPYAKFQLTAPDGTDLVSRIDAAVPNMSGAKNAINGSTAIEINVKPTVAGNYTMTWTPCADATGAGGAWLEEILGNVKVTYVPNAAGVIETNLLKDALATAKTILAANTDARYAGIDFDNLNAKIQAYDGKSYTAPSAYKNAAAELKAAGDAMKNHRQLCDTYDPLFASATKAYDALTGKKYANYPSYALLKAVMDKYQGKVLTDNTELTAAIAEYNKYISYANNTPGIVTALTDRINSGAAAAKKLGVDKADLYTAVDNAFSDDDNVAQMVRQNVMLALYKNIADKGDKYLFREQVDTTTLVNFTDSLNLSVFMKNPELYITTTDSHKMGDGTCPGWTIKLGDGYDAAYTTGWSWTMSESNPVANAMVGNWAKTFDMSQEITGLPVGVYDVAFGFGERNSDGTLSKAYAMNTEESDSVLNKVIGQTFPTDNLFIKNVTVKDGKLKVGVLTNTGSHVFFNDVHLFMVAPADGFDYAAAVKELATGINTVATKSNAAVIRTEYFDAVGRRCVAPAKGLSIQRQTLSDGSTRVVKVMNK